MKNPIDYKPMRAEEFIGPAKDMVPLLEQIAKRSIRHSSPIKLMIQGPPGIGKSALLEPFLKMVSAGEWSVTKLNGTQLNIEKLDEWARGLGLSDMFGGYRVLRIEEIDKASPAAQVRLLTVLDDLPERTAIICTSNKDLKSFEARLQSRFQVFTLNPPPENDVRWLLKKFGLGKNEINRIATFAAGNVRLALFDAQSALDEAAARN